jgi:integrase
MKKTRKWVFIPIPSGAEDVPGQPDVAAALQSLPLKQGKYFFLAGTTDKSRRSTAPWYARMVHLFDLVAQHGVRLSVHPHPHRFRHTYAARLLELGMDVRDVAELLGDSVGVVLKHYARYTAKQQEMAAHKWRQAMLAGLEQRKRKLHVIQGQR